MGQRIVVFGNCQAESVGAAISAIPELEVESYVYIPSFNITEEEIKNRLDAETIDGCTLLLEQVMPYVRLDSEYKFPNARRVTFPSLDLNLLWPLRAEEKRMRPEPPTFPFGRFTYGDRVINEVLAKGLGGDEAWDYFQHRSTALIPNLDRLWQIEEKRWTEIEANLDARMADLVFPMLRKKRLFWTYNHPNRLMLCYLGGRILQAAGVVAGDDQAACDLMWSVLTWEFGADYHQPIHPLVGERLGLDWWHPSILYRRVNEELQYETFIRRQIAWD